MNWLQQGSEKLVSLVKDIELLEAVSTLERFYDEKGVEGGINQLTYDFKLLEQESSEVSRQRELLIKNEIDLSKAIEQWNKLNDFWRDHIPEEYEALGYPLSEISADSGLKGKAIDWPILETGDLSHDDSIDTLSLEFLADANLSISFEACPQKLPLSIPAQSLKKFVSMGVNADLKVGAEAELSYTPIKLSGDAEAEGKATANWYFRNNAKRFYAQALANNVKELVSPFKLEQLAEKLDSSRSGPSLACLSYKHSHNRSYGGQITLSKAILPGLSGSHSFSGSFSYRVKYPGSFEYLLYEEEGKPTLNISRSKGRERESETNLALSCDLSPLYSQFSDLLFKATDHSYQVLENLKDILPRDQLLQSHIKGLLQARIENDENRLLIQAALGFGGDAGDLLSEAILSEVETSLTRWRGVTTETVSDISGKVISRLELSDSVALKLRQIIDDEVKSTLDSEEKRLKQKLDDLLQSGKLEGVLTKLAAVGGKFAQADQRIDAAVESVKTFLEFYQQKITDLKAILEQAAKAKLVAEWNRTETETSSKTVELKLRFNQTNSQAQRLYQRILTGSLDEVTAIMYRSDNQVIEIVEGELTKILGFKSQSEIGIKFFGLEFEQERCVTAETVFSIDSKGDVQAQSRGEITKLAKTTSGLSHDIKPSLVPPSCIQKLAGGTIASGKTLANKQKRRE